jgi:hypothetical protein
MQPTASLLELLRNDTHVWVEGLARWLKGPTRKNVRSSTYARYEQLSRKHLVPALGRMQLKKLSAIHLEGLYEAKLEEGLAPRTVTTSTSRYRRR